MVDLTNMRLVLVCIVLFLVPAGCLFITDRMVTNIEQDFAADAQSQIDRLDRIVQMNPPRIRTMRTAPLILELKTLGSGSRIARQVCASTDSPYRRLFDLLPIRCGRYDLLRRARWSALLSVIGTVFVLALVLLARITVTRYEKQQQWPGNWSLWFVLKGIQALVAVQAAVALTGCGILLHSVIAKTFLVVLAMVLPFVGLYWVERRLVKAFVEPHKLRKYRVSGVQGRPRRTAPA